MARTILIASGKGGVGKSTVTSLLGMALSSKGFHTLLIDCDAGLSSLDVMLGLRENTAFSWYDVYLDRCTPQEATVNANEYLSLLKAPEMTLPDATEAIKQITDTVKNNYDYILIDAPAGLNEGLLRAAAAAKQAIVIATADEISVKSAAALSDTLEKLGITQTRLLINRYDLKAAKKGKLLPIDTIIDKTYVRLLGIIPEDKSITYSTVTGKIDKKSGAVKAIERISQRIQGKNTELTLHLLK